MNVQAHQVELQGPALSKSDFNEIKLVYYYGTFHVIWKRLGKSVKIMFYPSLSVDCFVWQNLSPHTTALDADYKQCSLSFIPNHRIGDRFNVTMETVSVIARCCPESPHFLNPSGDMMTSQATFVPSCHVFSATYARRAAQLRSAIDSSIHKAWSMPSLIHTLFDKITSSITDNSTDSPFGRCNPHYFTENLVHTIPA